ncbi:MULTISPECIES: M1 family metallopeptidase [Asticcacaulis]|uniref:M1 family metallopeptidase n=1 Tax=Asticcacaulis TaxID=76890 RepID=UPI001AE4FF2B|nr:MULTISPECIES: M1 family metallopeptidase [Asticcacaulis]MBP2160209.1 aminopeptidase N [Asticcacaulis solisilvae]MDR6801254.1 aminopeptidase N [Asticcacaulis sp. BE141]
MRHITLRTSAIVRRLTAAAAAVLMLGAGAAGLTACQPKPSGRATPEAMVARTVDDHSYARPQEARVRHVDLDLTADFNKKVLRGTASLQLETEANAKRVVLDTRALDIEKVTDGSGAPLKYTLGKNDPMMGAPLTVELPQGAQKVVVHYQTTPEGTALQWLSPAQTAGKQKPFLFSQGQEIHTRTWVPTQDSPAIRQTYKARIVVPSDLTVVMAAKQLTPKGEAVPGQPRQRAFRFELDKPVAPYLIALAVGDIGFKAVGDRTGVFAEKVTLDKAAAELSDMEAMLDAAEKIYGDYRWDRYDVLILPPSFPYGGMENPMVTFATPTILAGDKSLVSLIAHELAHSWSGNLVTNATWEDFWLNEGFTTYFENRIMEQVYGPERARMLQVLGYHDLQETLDDLSAAGTPDFTRLHPDLKGVSPDAYFSDVPYEKGAAFLRMLEARFGRKKFDAYVKGYFERYKFKSMTTEAFLVDLRTNLLNNNADLEKQLQIHQWLYERGLPSNAIVPTSPALDQVMAQIQSFAGGADVKTLDVSGYSTQHWQYFLTQMPDTITLEQMAALDGQFKFTESQNAEIRAAWLTLAIKKHYLPAMTAVRDFLLAQGRAKFCRPLYTELMKQPGWGVDMARRIYAEARPGYHDVTRAVVDKIVK